jgi:hypothetical protein
MRQICGPVWHSQRPTHRRHTVSEESALRRPGQYLVTPLTRSNKLKVERDESMWSTQHPNEVELMIMFKNKFVINLFNFCKHSKSAPFHTFIYSPHFIPYHFSVYSSHLNLSWSKKSLSYRKTHSMLLRSSNTCIILMSSNYYSFNMGLLFYCFISSCWKKHGSFEHT